MGDLIVLPNPCEISPHLLGFLNLHFKSRKDFSNASSVVSDLKKEYNDLDRNLGNLQRNLSSIFREWVSQSHSAEKGLRRIDLKLRGFDRLVSGDGIGVVEMDRIRTILGKELSLLNKELGRIEIVRIYAETTLQLESLVGNLEDAVFAFMNQNPRNIFSKKNSNASSPTDIGQKQEKLLLAIKALMDIEEILLSVAKSRSPQWTHLLTAVDSRVDKTLAVLRPQALADHRSLLVSIGWPPRLLTSNLEREKGSEFPNPLVFMQGDKKERYYQTFLALCALQHLQTRREVRLHKGHQLLESMESFNKLRIDCCLWTIDELVSPIASRTEHHFSRWANQPEFIFALVYRITRDFVQGVDDVLQPLIDKARLVGYSAREAWVSAMVKMLSGYMGKRIFSVIVERYDNENENSEVISSWLHLVDLIIAFDKQMQGLATSGTALFDGISESISVLSIFCERPRWLRIWAEIELKDAKAKLKSELENDKAWMIDIKQETDLVDGIESESFFLATREDYKAPLITEYIIRSAWEMIERCRTLPNLLHQIQFIRSSASSFLNQFFDLLLQHCMEIESGTTYIDDDALQRTLCSINSARYCESVLQEWSEDISFLEMKIAEDDSYGRIKDDPDQESCFFSDEIEKLMRLETDWLVEIIASLLRQFDTLCWDYVQNREQWDKVEAHIDEEGVSSAIDVTVSVRLVESLDTLRDRFRISKMCLNSKDFLDLWRGVADGVDHFIFYSILLADAKFSDRGVDQFRADMQAMFLVFRPFCTRPEAFFPFIRDSLKLLDMGWEDSKHLRAVLSKGDKKMEWLRLHGVFCISPAQAEMILRNRKFCG